MKISIITINRNNLVGLSKTIESVVNQTVFDQIQYIVIDGASTDGSKDLIESYAYKLTYWVSEPDSGIYHAMNKGIKVATGEYCLFLNSGDWLVNNNLVKLIITEIESYKLKGNTPDIFLGRKIVIRPDGKIRKIKTKITSASVNTFYQFSIDHSASFIQRKLFDKFGLFDEELRIVSDWKWYIKALVLNHSNLVSTPNYVVFFDSTGISSINDQMLREEKRKVLQQILPEAVIADIDRYNENIDQIERLKRFPVIYFFVWLIERVLFRMDRWNEKHFSWKKYKP